MAQKKRQLKGLKFAFLLLDYLIQLCVSLLPPLCTHLFFSQQAFHVLRSLETRIFSISQINISVQKIFYCFFFYFEKNICSAVVHCDVALMEVLHFLILEKLFYFLNVMLNRERRIKMSEWGRIQISRKHWYWIEN
jgi:hypothetical protein